MIGLRFLPSSLSLNLILLPPVIILLVLYLYNEYVEKTPYGSGFGGGLPAGEEELAVFQETVKSTYPGIWGMPDWFGPPGSVKRGGIRVENKVMGMIRETMEGGAEIPVDEVSLDKMLVLVSE